MYDVTMNDSERLDQIVMLTLRASLPEEELTPVNGCVVRP